MHLHWLDQALYVFSLFIGSQSIYSFTVKDQLPKNTFYLPGLGADEGLFSEMIPLHHGKVLPWISPHQHEDLQSYAKRCAIAWDLPRHSLLIGFSFGGMVGKELLKHVDDLQVMMISGCRTARALDETFKQRVKRLQYMPDGLLRFMLVQAGPSYAKRSDNLKKSNYDQLKAMAKDIDLHFFRWACKACVGWDDNESINDRLLQIHGEHDKVIPYPKEDPDIIIKGAGHLLTFTHAKELVNIIRQNYQQHPSPN